MLPHKSKFLLLLCCILSLGFIATNLVGYFVARDSLSKQITTDTLPLIGDNIYSEIQRDLLKPIVISSVMANDTFLRDWIVAGEKNPDTIRRYLQKIQQSYQTVTSFFISDATLTYYHSSGILKTISPHNELDKWYFRAASMADSHEINIDFDPSNPSQLTVFINYKVLDAKGDLLGITGVGLALSAVQQLIEDYQYKYHREVFFIDKKAALTLHSSEFGKDAVFGNGIIDPAIKGKIINTDSTSFSYQQDSNEIFIDSRYIEEFDWYLIVRQTDEYLQGSIFNSLLINLLISMVITAAVLTFSWRTLSGYQQQLEKMAVTDKLTGLNNRQMLEPVLEQLFKLSSRHNYQLCVAVLDIDNFKAINDQYGHPFGDKVLVAVAQLIRGLTRESDVLCRWGGEEFLILMPNCCSLDAKSFGRKVQQQLATTSFNIEQRQINIELSIGISQKNTEDKPESLIFRADQALLSAKRAGRNTIVVS
ncbi:MAG: diguanylate cyclase [Pseudomonadales bacterium]|nr:diguanylate cyclase [Pseudomonadales bacterium]NRA15971.1 diguanylate cyclase [Oceanospirillaceae bacterium]